MDNLISRAAAIGCLGNSPEQMCMPWSEVERMLRELPAVDAAPVVHGRWVDADGNPVAWSKALPSSPEDSCMCSVCDTWLVGSDELPVYGLFCPACGAKMDGGRRDSDA